MIQDGLESGSNDTNEQDVNLQGPQWEAHYNKRINDQISVKCKSNKALIQEHECWVHISMCLVLWQALQEAW